MRVQVPSPRNLEIFHRLHDDGESIRSVGHEYELSTTRVVEIRDQVKRWYKLAAPDRDENEFRRQDAVCLCRLHQARSGRMYGIMMDAFRESRGEQRRACQQVGNSSTIVTYSPGDPKFLFAALRCSRDQIQTSLLVAKLPEEFFVLPDVEVAEMTPEEIAQEQREEAARAVAHEERREAAKEYLEDLQELADSMHDEEPPASVSTETAAAEPMPAAAPAEKASATPVDDMALDVAELLRQHTRHERRKKITPVQPTAENAEKRRELAAQLFAKAG